MKYSLAFMVFLAVSCGKYIPGSMTDTSIGEVRTLSVSPAAVTPETRTNVVAICNALLQKEAILSTAVNTTHTFTANQTDCQGSAISSGTQNVTIQRGSGGYVFRKVEGGDFMFPEIETTSSGVLSEICSNISNLRNPIIGRSEAVYFATSGINPSDCSPLFGELCIQVETAFVQGSTATIHTKDWLRIRTNPAQARLGFFSQRKRVTRSYCGQNEVLSFTATLK